VWYHRKIYSYRTEQFIWTDSEKKQKIKERKIKGSIGQKMEKIVKKEMNMYI
jgi:hypothetical protein